MHILRNKNGKKYVLSSTEMRWSYQGLVDYLAECHPSFPTGECLGAFHTPAGIRRPTIDELWKEVNQIAPKHAGRPSAVYKLSNEYSNSFGGMVAFFIERYNLQSNPPLPVIKEKVKHECCVPDCHCKCDCCVYPRFNCSLSEA